MSSAGTRPKDRIPHHVVRVLREQYGIDIEGQVPRPLDFARDRRFDRVITLCDKARESLPDAEYGPRAHWSIADPAASKDGRSTYSRYVSAAAEIDTRVRHLLPTLGVRMED